MLLGYKNALDALYDKYRGSKGQYSIIDTIVYPFCFVSRQIIELSIKYLYLKYASVSDNEKREFLDRNHDLSSEWRLLKPVLTKAKKHITTEVSIGDIEEYVIQMDEFDRTSMRMRYPVDKKFNTTNGNAQWLDIEVLYDGMTNYYHLIDQLNYDLERKVTISNDEESMRGFIDIYKQKRQEINGFLAALAKVDEPNTVSFQSLFDADAYWASDEGKAWCLYRDFDDDAKIVIECLFYVGRAILNEVNLPKGKAAKILAVTTLCVNQMRFDCMEFGKQIEEGQTNIYGKSASSTVENCLATMEYLDQFNLGEQ